jgi:hypothetical protein
VDDLLPTNETRISRHCQLHWFVNYDQALCKVHAGLHGSSLLLSNKEPSSPSLHSAVQGGLLPEGSYYLLGYRGSWVTGTCIAAQRRCE